MVIEAPIACSARPLFTLRQLLKEPQGPQRDVSCLIACNPAALNSNWPRSESEACPRDAASGRRRQTICHQAVGLVHPFPIKIKRATLNVAEQLGMRNVRRSGLRPYRTGNSCGGRNAEETAAGQ